MDTRRLAAFVKVVDVGSITRAANILNVAQPGLSQQILSLEHELKARLLDRSPRGVTPTPAGMTLYRHAQRILRQMDEALVNVSRTDRRLNGHVSVGLTAWSSASVLAPELIEAIRHAYPGILLQVCDTFPVPFSEMVLKRQLDMAYIYSGATGRGLRYHDCGRETLVLAVPPGLLPDQNGPVDPRMLARIPLIGAPVTSFQRQLVERACASIGEKANIVAEVYTLEVLGATLASGFGGAVLPRRIAALLGKRTELALLPIDYDMSLPLALCIPETEPLSEAAAAVYGVLLSLISSGP